LFLRLAFSSSMRISMDCSSFTTFVLIFSIEVPSDWEPTPLWTSSKVYTPNNQHRKAIIFLQKKKEEEPSHCCWDLHIQLVLDNLLCLVVTILMVLVAVVQKSFLLTQVQNESLIIVRKIFLGEQS
jgi:hypothetical protein